MYDTTYETDNKRESLHLGATLVDVRLDLQWLDPCSNFECNDFFQPSDAEKNEEIIPRGLGIEFDNEDSQIVNKDLLRVDSLPELESDYPTSESNFSLDECRTEHSTPAQIMLDLLPEDNGRFGSFYSDIYDYRTLELHILEGTKTRTYTNGDGDQRRLSSSSSVYSQMSPDSEPEIDLWVEPVKPLVVQKESPVPPPLTTNKKTNQLLKVPGEDTLDKAGNNKRYSRNIRNLELYLSSLSVGDMLDAPRSLPSLRRDLDVSSEKKDLKPMDSNNKLKPKLTLVIPGHISSAIQPTEGNLQVSHKATDIRNQPSTRTTRKSSVHGRAPSVQLKARRAVHADKLTVAHAQLRPVSDSCRNNNGKMGKRCRFDENWPGESCVRRRCLVSPIKDLRSTKSLSSLNINKNLPPLPNTNMEDRDTWI